MRTVSAGLKLGLCLLAAVSIAIAHGDDDDAILLPTGKTITPLATPHSKLQYLNPGLPDFPDFLAGQAISTVISPDSKTLLLLTSGFNRLMDAQGKPVPSDSQEYVFIYDITGGTPHQTQVLKIPNTFAGIAFSPDGTHFYISGGKDDNVHTFARIANQWQEQGSPVALGHKSGLGFHLTGDPLSSGGVAVSPDGKTAIVANIYNDSLTFVNLVSGSVRYELDLRPGKTIVNLSAFPAASILFGYRSPTPPPRSRQACAIVNSSKSISPPLPGSPPASNFPVIPTR